MQGFRSTPAEPSPSGLMPITFEAPMLEFSNQEKYQLDYQIIPLDFSVPFPDIDWDEMMSDEEREEPIIFADGDNMRTEEVRLKAPLSLIGVTLTMMDEGGQEDEEADEYEDDYEEESINFPVAVSIGLVLNNPDDLSIEGELGPGSIANIALSDELTASRILAIAAPEQGFDLASIDFSSFTEFGYGEAREEIGWIKKMNNASNGFVKISMSGKKRIGIQTVRIITLLSIGVWKQVNLLKMICPFSLQMVFNSLMKTTKLSIQSWVGIQRNGTQTCSLPNSI